MIESSIAHFPPLRNEKPLGQWKQTVNFHTERLGQKETPPENRSFRRLSELLNGK